MRTTELTPNIVDTRQSIERTEESAITGEVAAHLIDLATHSSKTKVIQWIIKLSNIAKEEPAAFWILINIWSGDLHELTRSYAEQGKRDSRSKQACQQEMERALRVIHRLYPEVAKAIQDMRCITAKW